MIKPTYYTRDIERYITPIYSESGQHLIYQCIGSSKQESINRAELIQKMLDSLRELDDLNTALHEQRNEL